MNRADDYLVKERFRIKQADNFRLGLTADLDRYNALCK